MRSTNVLALMASKHQKQCYATNEIILPPNLAEGKLDIKESPRIQSPISTRAAKMTTMDWWRGHCCIAGSRLQHAAEWRGRCGVTVNVPAPRSEPSSTLHSVSAK